MEKYWVRRAGNRKLLIFTLGWSVDHAIAEHIRPPEYDLLYIYDYRDLEPLTHAERAAIESYPVCYLIAWSFGVLAAERLFSGMDFTRAVAFNGTPYPIHAGFGIDPRAFAATLRGLPLHGMDEFNRRAYGSEYGRMKDVLSPRPLQDNITELSALEKLAILPSEGILHWDKAVVGTFDAIFPPTNMAAYWRERAELLPLPHYPFADADIILREIDDR